MGEGGIAKKKMLYESQKLQFNLDRFDKLVNDGQVGCPIVQHLFFFVWFFCIFFNRNQVKIVL